MSVLLLVRAGFLFLALAYGFGVIARTLYRARSSGAQVTLFGLGVAGFVTSMGWLGSFE